MENKDTKKLIKVYENGLFKEYEVKIDREKLEKVKQAIIYNCSFIRHRTDEFPLGFGFKSNYKYKKYKILNVICGNYAFTRDGRDGPDVDYYTYTCDEYHFPKIVNIIDEILDGDITKIKDLFEETEELDSMDKYRDVKPLEKAKILLDDYIKNSDIETLNQLRSLIDNYEHPEMDAPKENVQTYFPKLKDCFEFIEVRCQDIADTDKVKEIFGDRWKEKLEGILQMQQYTSSDMDASFVKKFGKKDKH